MQLVIECPKYFNKDFELSGYGNYAKCKECGNEIFIKDSEFEIGYEDEKE